MHPRVEIDVYLDEAGALATMAEEVRRGLTSTPRHLPSKYFYDERGSWLFERITKLPEYYPTRTEQGLLEDLADEIARTAMPGEIVELGAGSATKTRLLLEAAHREAGLRHYGQVEVSRAMVEHSADRLCESYSWLSIHAVVGDFERHLDRVRPGERRLVVLLGSTVGNFPRPRAIPFLRNVAGLVGADGYLLLGADLVKDRAVLEAAYNDSEGVTADFNRNVLCVVNERLDGNFDPEAYRHVAFYNDPEERIEMHLEASSPQEVRVADLDLEFRVERSERIRTEVSCKYTRESLGSILAEAGLSLTHWYTDPAGAFALSLSRLA